MYKHFLYKLLYHFVLFLNIYHFNQIFHEPYIPPMNSRIFRYRIYSKNAKILKSFFSNTENKYFEFLMFFHNVDKMKFLLVKFIYFFFKHNK